MEIMFKIGDLVAMRSEVYRGGQRQLRYQDWLVGIVLRVNDNGTCRVQWSMGPNSFAQWVHENRLFPYKTVASLIEMNRTINDQDKPENRL